MSHTVHKDEKYMTEHFEDKESLDKKAKEMALLIKKSKHFVVFTGAGISTSAGNNFEIHL